MAAKETRMQVSFNREVLLHSKQLSSSGRSEPHPRVPDKYGPLIKWQHLSSGFQRSFSSLTVVVASITESNR